MSNLVHIAGDEHQGRVALQGRDAHVGEAAGHVHVAAEIGRLLHGQEILLLWRRSRTHFEVITFN